MSITLRFYLIFFFTLLAAHSAKAAVPPLTLDECYRMALRQSELIAVDKERIREAQARFMQAFGTVLPHVSFSHTDTRAETADSSTGRTTEQKFVFTQTLFSGFREMAGIAGSSHEKKQRQNELKRAQQLLFTDVSDAFYFLLEIRRDLEALETTRAALSERIADLREREKLGKSRPSEIASTATQLYNLEDQIQAVKSSEKVVNELLSFLIGAPAGELEDAEEMLMLKPEPVYVEKALARPDVKAAEYASRAAQDNVAVARSGLLPSVQVEADYLTYRNAAPKDSSWQGILSVNVPIFEGTTVIGQIKEANAKKRESELLHARAGRSAASQVRDAYTLAESTILRSRILKKGLEAAQLNYDLQKKDYSLNVVNNLDVLTALASLQEARRSYNHMYYQSKRAWRQLLIAAGELPAEGL